MKITAAITILSLLLISCGNREESKETVKIGGRYLLELPVSYKETTGLNDEASLQYQNAYKNIFVIVIDEHKSQLDLALETNSLYDVYTSDLNGYSNLILDNMKARLGVDSLPKMQNIKVRGLNAKLLSFSAVSEGLNLYWKIAFVEGNKRYYQINTWTLNENREKYDAELMDIISSFREIDKSKY